ncbi:uncharacterized protein G2W53_043491 [Senna tora]|uniref:Uncharacterized protein n=1 Tax=Senna tora TaxID=362788 RepID=A0A834W0L2_9FABA|nr:uncharacterized protein G2W53_043491 [Senna tora]
MTSHYWIRRSTSLVGRCVRLKKKSTPDTTHKRPMAHIFQKKSSFTKTLTIFINTFTFRQLYGIYGMPVPLVKYHGDPSFQISIDVKDV